MIFLFIFLYLLVAITQLVALTYFDARYNLFRGDSSFMIFVCAFWPMSLPMIVLALIGYGIGCLVDKLREYFQGNLK